MEEDLLRIEYIPLEEIQRWPRNPKKHDMGALVAAIERYGFVDPPKYDTALGALVYGNGRDEALEWMRAQGRPAPRGIRVDETGRWLVPIKFGVDAPSLVEAESLAIDHNNLTMSGGDFTAFDMARMWDAGYAELLEGLRIDDALPLTLDDDALASLLAGVGGPDAGGDDEFDTTPPEGPTRTALGDLWSISGNGLTHRLIVGDCTDPLVVERLMGGERADMMFTDPPYGVDYSGGHFHSGDVNIKRERERLAGDSNTEIYSEFLPVVLPYVDGPCYMWFAGSRARDVYNAVGDNECEVHALIIWHKINATYAAMNAQYKQRHEPCLYFKPKGSTLRWDGPSDECTVWEIRRDGVNEYHPTQKPIELASRAIGNHKARTVLDVFMGSGSTLIAAHRTGRRCYGCEIEPKYADVILRRVEAEGLTCVLAAGLTCTRQPHEAEITP